MDDEKIKQEAKEIMDNFMSALSDIEVEEEFLLERDEFSREENGGDDANGSFQNRFLENAPNTSGNAVVANRGEWTK